MIGMVDHLAIVTDVTEPRWIRYRVIGAWNYGRTFRGTIGIGDGGLMFRDEYTTKPMGRDLRKGDRLYLGDAWETETVRTVKVYLIDGDGKAYQIKYIKDASSGYDLDPEGDRMKLLLAWRCPLCRNTLTNRIHDCTKGEG